MKRPIYYSLADAVRFEGVWVDPRKTVDVYWNLHRKCWSVRQAGKVVAHCRTVALRNVQFVVGEAGRQRVLREQRKNVHAFARGFAAVYCLPSVLGNTEAWPVTYNPYKAGTFYQGCRVDFHPVTEASAAELLSSGKVWALDSK